ncbi:MAG TPA: tetraacyldisaccharide 4'-kinase [Niabella sp.]|nr:tetraacyldisaccharide 4'-kinase [Niabella sp.]
MSFSNIIKQKNILLVPFSWLYKAGVFFYHSLYDLKILTSYKPEVPVICVGNLSVGGTGKSPMVEYLLRLLANPFSEYSNGPQKLRTAVISRGYKRKTKGFLLAGENTLASDIGDEPMQFHKKFPGVAVAVGEERVPAIEQLLKQKPEINVIILDDAYQHRAVTAGFNILLTDYNNIFTGDGYLPAGTLRDLKSNYKRADVIVVTKCDEHLGNTGRQQVINSIRPLSHQQVFFTVIDYGSIYNVFNNERRELKEIREVMLVTGIANPEPLVNYLKRFNLQVEHLGFPDHYNFSEKDVGDILSAWQAAGIENKIILTTEKDAVRLIEWEHLKGMPVYALPVQHRFLFGEGNAFDDRIKNYLLQDMPG